MSYFTRAELFSIKHTLDEIRHCGDCGAFYVSILTRAVYLNLGDADEIDYHDLLNKLPPDIELIIEAECDPIEEGRWLLISRGTEAAEGFSYDQEDNLIGTTVEINPKLLTVEEYYDYYRFYKTLKT
jgi:hypothetical protein